MGSVEGPAVLVLSEAVYNAELSSDSTKIIDDKR